MKVLGRTQMDERENERNRREEEGVLHAELKGRPGMHKREGSCSGEQEESPAQRKENDCAKERRKRRKKSARRVRLCNWPQGTACVTQPVP